MTENDDDVSQAKVYARMSILFHCQQSFDCKRSELALQFVLLDLRNTTSRSTHF